ncbi:MAG: prepilin-type N-terminal cleavage/methylation domain-containing protein [Candidatus Omnitrophota bacterium]
MNFINPGFFIRFTDKWLFLRSKNKKNHFERIFFLSFDKKNISGFSLIELLITLFLAALLFSLLISLYKPYREYISLRKNVWILASDLRAFRQQAIISHYNYAFVFDLNNESYTIEKRTYPDNSFVENVKNEILNIDIVAAVNFRFEPQGNANLFSSITLQNPSGDLNTIIVSATTGNVRISK